MGRWRKRHSTLWAGGRRYECFNINQAEVLQSMGVSRGIEKLLSEQCGRVLSDKLAPIQDWQIAWIDGM
ncbi:hypothetical protein NPIL_580851 [Nephila pilipes]|uniref:Uncharacterized protein n=1 Tax=Nephila pilipes TaxID=299642 RepID=A0A8X6UL63_NEPPI|nr:hypothetical protein NPIL_580851 [Nephila pilipes]